MSYQYPAKKLYLKSNPLVPYETYPPSRKWSCLYIHDLETPAGPLA
jgi:hypothetical protein